MKTIYNINHFFIGKDYLKEFDEEVLENNAIHLKILFMVLCIVDIVLLMLEVNVFKFLYKSEIGYRNFLYTHVLLLVLSVSYLTLITNINKKFYKGLNNIFILLVMTLITFFSINSQLPHGQISAYIIGIFCLASIITINPYESIFFFLVQYFFYVIGVLGIDTEWQFKATNITSASILTVIALALANFNYANYINNFKNKRAILTKNEEIKNLYNITDATLNKRTQQLMEANELLIKEINEKHKMELEVIRTGLLVEEKQKLLNEKIEYENLRTAFFANISHELRTPLTVIFSAEQMLALILKKSHIESNIQDINKYIYIIKQNCYRLIRLIGNFIDITKIDSAYFEICLKNKDIIKIVEDITLSVANFIEDKNLNLVFDTEIEEKILAVDEDKMERVILNLLSNAVKFTPAGGSIHVNIYDKTDKIIISVKDTGIGIPKDRLDTIFDRFVQVDKSMSRNREGSGIGLSIVSSIIEMHKGKIFIKSEEGYGSEFIIELPVENPAISGEVTETIECQDNINIEMINIEFSDIYT